MLPLYRYRWISRLAASKVDVCGFRRAPPCTWLLLLQRVSQFVLLACLLQRRDDVAVHKSGRRSQTPHFEKFRPVFGFASRQIPSHCRSSALFETSGTSSRTSKALAHGRPPARRTPKGGNSGKLPNMGAVSYLLHMFTHLHIYRHR